MNNIQQLIKNACLLNLKEESCGFFYDDSIYPCTNIAVNKANSFKISSKDYIIANKIKPLGIYHSHPNGPQKHSLYDRIKSEQNNLSSIVYDLKSDSFNYYFPNGFLKKYLGIPFKIGANDCLSLARKFFKNEYNVNIIDYPRSEDWQDKNPNYFIDNYEKENFIEVKEAKEGDIFLIKFLKNYPPTHILIYLGGELVLHHPRNEPSCITIYSEPWQIRTAITLRHKICF